MSYKTFTVHFYSYNEDMGRYEMKHETFDEYQDVVRFLDVLVASDSMRLISVDTTW